MLTLPFAKEAMQSRLGPVFGLGFWKESVLELEVNWARAVTPTQSEMW